MAEVVTLAKSDGVPGLPPDFVMTETAREIHRSLDHMRNMTGFRMALICGAAGIGKSLAILDYMKGKARCEFFNGAAEESNAMALAENLCFHLGLTNWQNASLLTRRTILVPALARYDFIVIDEAQNYTLKALSWLRIVCAEAGCDLVLSGGHQLYAVAMADDQIESRTVRPRLFPASKPGDVQAFAASHGLNRDGIPKELELVAMRGGLRRVRNVIEVATLFAGGAPVTLDHIRAAIADLGLSGGKA